jgi:hypothetical protein
MNFRKLRHKYYRRVVIALLSFLQIYFLFRMTWKKDENGRRKVREKKQKRKIWKERMNERDRRKQKVWRIKEGREFMCKKEGLIGQERPRSRRHIKRKLRNKWKTNTKINRKNRERDVWSKAKCRFTMQQTSSKRKMEKRMKEIVEEDLNDVKLWKWFMCMWQNQPLIQGLFLLMRREPEPEACHSFSSNASSWNGLTVHNSLRFWVQCMRRCVLLISCTSISTLLDA